MESLYSSIITFIFERPKQYDDFVGYDKGRSAPNTVVVCCLPYIYNRGMSKDKKKDQKKKFLDTKLLFFLFFALPLRQNSTLFPLKTLKVCLASRLHLTKKTKKKDTEQHQQTIIVRGGKGAPPPVLRRLPSFLKKEMVERTEHAQFSGRAYSRPLFDFSFRACCKNNHE